jgi:hypothetical protein
MFMLSFHEAFLFKSTQMGCDWMSIVVERKHAVIDSIDMVEFPHEWSFRIPCYNTF